MPIDFKDFLNNETSDHNAKMQKVNDALKKKDDEKAAFVVESNELFKSVVIPTLTELVNITNSTSGNNATNTQLFQKATYHSAHQIVSASFSIATGKIFQIDVVSSPETKKISLNYITSRNASKTQYFNVNEVTADLIQGKVMEHLKS